jgi:hypothetical protein
MKFLHISLVLVMAPILFSCVASEKTLPNALESGANLVENNSPEVEKAGNLPECVKKRCRCKDFKTQAEAQTVLKAFPSDPHKLDRNKDGIACQTLP